MSIPLNTFTVTPVVTAFLPPLTDSYNALAMRATGGVAIGNGSQGREVQFWSCFYDGVNINVADALGVVQFQLAIAGVRSVCLAFDSNMAVTLCYTTDAGGFLYFFNSQIGGYQTNAYPDILSCRVAVDKTTAFFNAQSDVIFAYVKTNGIPFWRQQRDRYAIERQVTPAPPLTADNPLIRLGPTQGNRLQMEWLVPAPPVPPSPPITVTGVLPSLSLQRLIDIESVFD